MTFEEQFPTLAFVKCRTFTDKCLMKTCLDKAKVKIAIRNINYFKTGYSKIQLYNIMNVLDIKNYSKFKGELEKLTPEISYKDNALIKIEKELNL